VGIFAKVLLAVAILVANGALLFFILRFLLWLAFPGKEHEAVAARPATGASRTAAAAAAGEGGEAAAVAATAADQAAEAPPAAGLPALAPALAGRPRAYPHRLLIGLPVILALFAGGVWLGSVVGGSGTAAAATKYIRVHGRVITVNHTTEVRVPAQTVKIKGSIVSVPATTVKLPPHVVTSQVVRTHTQVLTLPAKTRTTTTTIAIPTTITGPTTTATITVTSTVTSTTGSTSTASTT
jgi:hypothetical protein